MRIQANVAALVALVISNCALGAMAQTTTSNAPASAASSGSRENVGAMPGVAPTPAMAPSSSPKLVRHTPGRGTVTQPASGASSSMSSRGAMSSPARTGASSPTDKAGGK